MEINKAELKRWNTKAN